MLRFSKAFLLLLPFLLLVACNDEEAPHNARMMKAAMGGFASTDAVMLEGASSSMRAANMAIDRSQLGDKRIAETHNLEVEIAQDLIRTRQQADFTRCLQMKCEIIDSQSNKNYARLAVRIVPEQLGDYLTALENGQGEISSHNVSVDDRTMQYIDTEANLKTKQALKERLTKLLNSEAVRNVNELLRVERELSRVQREIDSATGQMRHLQNETAKVRVSVDYRVPIYARAIDYKELKASFFNAWRGFIDSVSEVVEFVGRSLPWVPVLMLGLWLFIRVLKGAFTSTGWRLWRKK